ncbi:hypothetical protein HBI56_124870 [Parastagonospora nodorum]|nr:hypothetical protein HBI06_157950 [Parastagonospora nodorum]KAH4248894.1 hypothetical protein HBI05_025700 [Parastagonospora nodorum]KAH5153267.1 hypothetical protein HBH69_128660 [Parastagonospora nodorum]KAH6217279.1 hypothetical protein HBI15_126420 [Parastagonospora nodorum]KAH6510165.1 hypothetical protein HBI56_124870 [Parastagonospora nodorum]
MSTNSGEDCLMPSTATAAATVTRAINAATAERNDRESPLLRLPAELHNQIYEYALTDGMYELRAPKGGICPYPAGIGIAGVCQKLYYEASVLSFTLNEFHCGVAADLVKLHSRLSIRQLSAITNVSFSNHMQIPVMFNGRLMTPSSEMESQRSGVCFREFFPNAQRVTLAEDCHPYPYPYYGIRPRWDPVISSWVGGRRNAGLVIVYKESCD